MLAYEVHIKDWKIEQGLLKFFSFSTLLGLFANRFSCWALQPAQ